ncbi:MAG TPA: hypothetical protein VFX96_00100 [Pyrinomonadaceae bacterium]|nr:hypothetical protein [Pyrinomonadaceae bacterium]
MTPRPQLEPAPDGWLAFELSILRRLKFRTAVNPLAGEPVLDVYLKRWGVGVSSNDPARWAATKCLARVENNTVSLTKDDVAAVLEDAYVPRYRLQNAALGKWFGETDAWWFDNVRASAERLEDPVKRALALSLVMSVGDYALSFDDETRELRQPLSKVFTRLWEAAPAPVNNSQTNRSANKDARDFLAAERADCLFLRLPRPTRAGARDSAWAWREEFVRGSEDFWDEFESARAGRLGARAETRQQYLRHVEELLDVAGHIPAWAVAYAENGFVSTEEVVESIRRVRKVATIYTKDFSELTGARAAIITA